MLLNMFFLLSMVQRYGDFWGYEIPHVGYSAYHKYGILPLFTPTPYLYIGVKSEKIDKMFGSFKENTYFCQQKAKT